MRRYHGEAPGQPRPGDDASSRRRAAAAARERRLRIRRRLIWAAYALAGLLVVAFLAWHGRDYYPLARAARRASPLHATLRSAGGFGHGVGIVATAFMLSNFLYAARKRWTRLLGRLGEHPGLARLPRLRRLHEPAGDRLPRRLPVQQPAGHLHRQRRSAIVVSTGMVGRFIYGAVPSDGGKAVELSDLLASFERLRDAAGAAAWPRPALRRGRCWSAPPPRSGPARWPCSSSSCRWRRSCSALRLIRVRRRFSGRRAYRRLPPGGGAAGPHPLADPVLRLPQAAPPRLAGLPRRRWPYSWCWPSQRTSASPSTWATGYSGDNRPAPPSTRSRHPGRPGSGSRPGRPPGAGR